MLRGDVDRFFRALRQDNPSPPTSACKQLDHVREISRYYHGMSQEERLLLLAWAKKEESGIGTIPLALSGIPFAGLLFGSRIQEPLAKLPVWAIFTIWGTAALLLVSGFYLHQRQKAYTMLHIVLLEQATKKAEAKSSGQPECPTQAKTPEPQQEVSANSMSPH